MRGMRYQELGRKISWKAWWHIWSVGKREKVVIFSEVQCRVSAFQVHWTWMHLVAPDCKLTWLHLNLITPNCTWLHLIAPDCSWYMTIHEKGWVEICVKGVKYLNFDTYKTNFPNMCGSYHLSRHFYEDLSFHNCSKILTWFKTYVGQRTENDVIKPIKGNALTASDIIKGRPSVDSLSFFSAHSKEGPSLKVNRQIGHNALIFKGIC